MVNYGESMIYKLCCKDSNITDFYIGSTTNFSRRKSQHKKNCNNQTDEHYNLKVYKIIRDNGGFENFDMILIEKVNVDNKRDLEKIERKYIDELKPSLNSIRSYISIEEKKSEKVYYDKNYRELNKEEKAKTDKIYRELNKEKVKLKKQEYHINNKDKINKKTRDWYANNKDKVKEYNEKNKENIKEKRNLKQNCQFCNCIIRKSYLKKHQKSIKCMKFQCIED